MRPEEITNDGLLALLREMDFDRRYYQRATQEKSEMEGFRPKDDLGAALDRSSLEFRYRSTERFFAHLEDNGGWTIGLNIAPQRSALEFILVMKNNKGHVGDPFHLLAYQVGKLRDPNFSPDPPYPTVEFSNAEELTEAVDFGLGLYEDVKRAVAAGAAEGSP